MSEKVEVSPTPIQRNHYDVAVELTQLYYKLSPNADPEMIDAVYARFYATARTLGHPRFEELDKYLKI